MQSYQRFQCIGHTDFNTSGTNGPRGETGAFPPPVTAGLCVASEIALNAAFATLDSATLLYTYISRFSVTPHYRQQLYLRPSFIPIFNFSHKRPTFAFTGKSGYTLGLGCFGWGWYHYPRSVPRVLKTLRGRGLKRQTLPLLGLGRGYSRRTQRASGTAMRLCASLSRGVATPLGCVIFFHFCRNCDLYAIRACAR